MTNNTDRKSAARTLAGLLDIKYTSALRLQETAVALRQEKIDGFPAQQIRRGDLLTGGEVDPAFPLEIHDHPWNWTPVGGFTRRGKAQDPRLLFEFVDHSRMNRRGMTPFVAFELGAGIGTSTSSFHYRKTELRAMHPAAAIARNIDEPPFNLSSAAQLGFAARGTGWVTDSVAGKRIVLRFIAEAMSSLFRETGTALGGFDEADLNFVANRLDEHRDDRFGFSESGYSITEDDYYKSATESRAASLLDTAAYITDAVLFDFSKLGTVIKGSYWASPKRMDHLFGVVGPERTERFIISLAGLFDALYIWGEH